MYNNGPDPTNAQVCPKSPDGVGDCTIAEKAHGFGAQSFLVTGTVALFPNSEIISAYSAVSGYNVKTGADDNGASLEDVCTYMTKTGMTDTLGVRHTIAAWATLDDPTDLAMLKRVLYTFGTVTLAFNLPQSAEDAFPNPWVYVPGSPVLGGHAVPLQYSNSGELDGEQLVSWAQYVKTNNAFMNHYCVQAVAYASSTWVAKNGTNPINGIALPDLIADTKVAASTA
jgi:hypothetical protein